MFSIFANLYLQILRFLADLMPRMQETGRDFLRDFTP